MDLSDQNLRLVAYVRNLVSECQAQLNIAERAQQSNTFESSQEFDEECDIFGSKLQSLFIAVALLLERVGLTGMQSEILRGLRARKNTLCQLDAVNDYPEILYSEPFYYLQRFVNALDPLMGDEDTARYGGIQILERILKRTAVIVHQANITPQSEADVRQPIFHVLKAVFADVVRDPPIPQISKTYKPDFGVRDLRAAVEFKYATDENEIKREIEQIYSDMLGYNGTSDWNRFYAVIYVTKPMLSAEEVWTEFKHVGASARWTPLVVHGYGTRTRKNTALAAVP